MARGRRKDLTVPPTRALQAQRAYRVRKQHGFSELQERCRRLESENKAMRQQIGYLQRGVTSENTVELVRIFHFATIMF